MSKHAAGPWGLRITETGPWAVFNADGNWIAVTTRKQWKDEDRATARLIAAAPDLLEALRITRGNVASLGPAGVFEPYTEYREWLAMIDAAIAKATGEA